MPKLTAPQLLWTGVAVVVVGFVGSWVSQVLLFRWWGYGWFSSIGTVLGGSLVTVGSALVAGAFVVGALQRGASPAAPRPGAYPPPGVPGAYPPPGTYPPPPGAAASPYAPPPAPAPAPPVPGPQAGPAPDEH